MTPTHKHTNLVEMPERTFIETIAYSIVVPAIVAIVAIGAFAIVFSLFNLK